MTSLSPIRFGLVNVKHCKAEQKTSDRQTVNATLQIEGTTDLKEFQPLFENEPSSDPKDTKKAIFISYDGGHKTLSWTAGTFGKLQRLGSQEQVDALMDLVAKPSFPFGDGVKNFLLSTIGAKAKELGFQVPHQYTAFVQ